MKNFFLIIITTFIIACQTDKKVETKAISIDEIAEQYVRLALEIGQYDDDFVDAYFGPTEWKPSGEITEPMPSNDFIIRAAKLIRKCEELNNTELSVTKQKRLLALRKQLVAVKTKVEMIAGTIYLFDMEAKFLYDARPPTYSAAHFDSLINLLDSNLPGKGTISERYLTYSKQFIIPPEKLDTVFKTAITEARKRTKKHLNLPDNEDFILEYVTDKSWSAYNYYLGNGQSKIQFNTDNPSGIEKVIDLACHEGYPGHHVFMTLLDQNLYQKKGWAEYSIYPLFSPLSLISEGSANYGIDVAFPGSERIKYEQEVLFPMAGIDPSLAVQYYEIQDLRAQLNYADNEAGRQFLNGEISREEAISWLMKYRFYDYDRAKRKTLFYDQYRSYIINYNLGKDLVTRHISALGGTADQPQKRWDLFKDLLSHPPVPSDLKE